MTRWILAPKCNATFLGRWWPTQSRLGAILQHRLPQSQVRLAVGVSFAKERVQRAAVQQRQDRGKRLSIRRFTIRLIQQLSSLALTLVEPQLENVTHTDHANKSMIIVHWEMANIL